ncbi:MAG TPA: glycosyl hydrolase family 28-related protein [Candidatus Hydrogenedentes bacterium]|nr:glycosyl hydrolase family 28-related protein [Candidatus Hydrogenedentota bacterium]HPC16230.1 glycosyl hydrolase family 28-related protein [Candidatus Hydrogenedentota bacterium]HRT18558.1 glycosyl hydrolase family 28-related protein [Candidatus Hydrogenedentota bacterium]HRT63577.1 glycosyl hydrolase family 28-related protein [Candidatus Hydrogenedentota bacterium]
MLPASQCYLDFRMIGSQRIHSVVGFVSATILLLGSLVAGADRIKPCVQNASACGAKGNGIEDDTAALQQALDTTSAAGGGIVSLPAGKYLIKGHLTIPENVTLEGIWRAPVNGNPFDSGSV